MKKQQLPSEAFLSISGDLFFESLPTDAEW